MAAESVPTALSGIAEILQAIAWPVVALIILRTYRGRFSAIVDIVALKLKDAKEPLKIAEL